MKRFTFLLGIIVFASSSICYAQDSKDQVMKAVKIWETDEIFHIPESVFYDKDYDLLYVSNIDGSPVVKDENGYISKLSTDGKIIELRWITGLHAPKGMGKFKDKLFVTDIDNLIEIDAATGEILNRYTAEGALFLNDIAIDKKGMVYFSDYQGNAVYRFYDGEIQRWLEHEELEYPNGLYYQSGKLYIGCRDKILTVDPFDQEIEIVVQETGSIDGLNIDEDGNFIISDFYGKVQCITPSGNKHLLFDTSFETINAADIYYEKSNHVLYVPTFRAGKVMAYEIIK